MSENQKSRMLVPFEKPPVPQTVEDIFDYYEYQSRKDPGYTGFEFCAQQLIDGISQVKRMAAVGEKFNFDVPLSPAGPKLYKKHGIEGSWAMRVYLIELTNSEVKSQQMVTEEDNRGNEHEYGSVWYQGHDLGSVVNIVEVHDSDEFGDFLTLTLVSEVPDELIPCISGSDQMKMFNQVTADIEALDSGQYSLEDLKAA